MVGGMSASSSVATMSVTSGAGSGISRTSRHLHHQAPRARHHRQHRPDYQTEHDTDRASSPRIGQRSQSLSALQPTAVIQPRMAQLETLEAKMASIEVSLSSGTPRRKKCAGASPIAAPRTAINANNAAGTATTTATTTTPTLEQLESLRIALRDKESIIQSLRSNNGLRSLIGGLQGSKEREVLTETERRQLEARVQRVRADTDNKRLAIKNLKHALDKLDVSDNIDVRIQQAELEYQLGREELNLLTLLEDMRAVQTRLDESAAAVQRARARSGTVFGCVRELGGRARLVAVETKWEAGSPRFGAAGRDGGLWVEWALDDTGLRKDDRLIEVNGKLVVTRSNSRDDLIRLLNATPESAQLVVLRGDTVPESTQPANGANGDVSALRSELNLVRERAEEAQRAKDGLRADNLRLTHRISYLEEQVSELLESRRHRHHNHHHPHQHHRTTQQEQQVRVVTTTPINNNQNVTNINIGTTDVQVFQKGPQVTALVGSSPRPTVPPRTPSSPCLAASDRYTPDDPDRKSPEARPARSRSRPDVRSVKSLDVDLEPHPAPSQHYAKPRKAVDYASEPAAPALKKRPTPPKKPIRLSLHRAQSLQSVENGDGSSEGGMNNGHVSGRKRTHRGERSVSGLRWPQHGLTAVAVHLHQRQAARWC